MKLFDCFAAPGYHTSIITTFAIDFDAYESIALPRLRDSGCNNNILIADARMLGYAMGDDSRRPKVAGRRYSVVGAGVGASGVFHPKLILQLGKSKGRLLVASANMTTAGLAGNLEVVGEVETDEGSSQAVPLLRAALEYLAQFLADTSISRQQVDWAMKRARWLYNAEPAGVLVDVADGGRMAFLARNHPLGIGARFIELVGSRVVKRLIAISPYWDFRLNALRMLRDGVGAQRTSVLIQARSALFPAGSLRSNDGIKLFEVNGVRGTVASRFAHAKVLIAESRDGDCILFGSANCTAAALGSNVSPGTNEEACLYREVPSGQAVKMLGLDEALSAAKELKVADLPEYTPTDDIALDDLESNLPGRFELSGDLLRWWPPSRTGAEVAKIQLFDQSGGSVGEEPVRLGTQNNPVTYRLEGDIQPHFASVRVDGVESSLAIIVVEQAIQESQRRAMSKGVVTALGLLDDEEAFEGLWLLEVIQKLEHAERDSRTTRTGTEAPPRQGPSASEQDDSQVLPYEQFVAGRKAQGSVSAAGSHLASTHNESVRTFLNALVGKRSGQIFAGDDEDEEALPDLPLGDETSDGEGALERDDRFDTASQGTDRGDERKQLLKRRQEYVKDTQRTIDEAVERFLANLRLQTQSRPLGVVDLLRLRAVLMVVLGAGSKKSDLLPKELVAVVHRRQVLPSKGDVSWRRLAGRLLYDFFREAGSARAPLIKSLVLEEDVATGLPEDVLECWATCYWAACACRVAVDEKAQPFNVSASEEQLARDLYKYTNLLPEQALGEVVHSVSEGMNARYAVRLGVAPNDLNEEHGRLVAAVKARAGSEAR